jgi:Protein of unknown function (DUF2568)
MTGLQRFNLILRATMETGVVVAFAWWGVVTGAGTGTKALLGIGAPMAGFGFWGLIDFRQAGRWSEPLRFVQELAISGLAAVAWYVAGQHVLGWSLALLSVFYHALVYVAGDRLLKPQGR